MGVPGRGAARGPQAGAGDPVVVPVLTVPVVEVLVPEPEELPDPLLEPEELLDPVLEPEEVLDPVLEPEVVEVVVNPVDEPEVVEVVVNPVVVPEVVELVADPEVVPLPEPPVVEELFAEVPVVEPL